MERCDECKFLQIEPPVNRYDVWRAHCCDPDKPVMGARRTVDTAPASSETGPIGIQRPAWCRRGESPTRLRREPPLGKGAKGGGKKKAVTVAETP